MATTTLPNTGIMETKPAETKSASTKYVYFFGGGKAEGNGKMKDVLGGKGAGLAEMTNAGCPCLLASPSKPRPAASTCATTRCRKKWTARWKRRWQNSKVCRARNSARERTRCW